VNVFEILHWFHGQNMLKVLEQLNSEPRVILEKIDARRSTLCPAVTVAATASEILSEGGSDANGVGDVSSSSGNMQSYMVKKPTDPNMSASLSLTLVGTGVSAQIKRKISLEEALSDADEAYNKRPKKAKKEGLVTYKPSATKSKGLPSTRAPKSDSLQTSDSEKDKASNKKKKDKTERSKGSVSSDHGLGPASGDAVELCPDHEEHQRKEKKKEKKSKKTKEMRPSTSEKDSQLTLKVVKLIHLFFSDVALLSIFIISCPRFPI